MKSAARLIPTLSQPLRASARPICLSLLSRPIAGPSTLSLPRRHATTTSLSPSGAAPAQTTEAQEELNEEDFPSNVTFEELSEEADEEIERALGRSDADLATFFPSQTSVHEPILLPVSSLASTTPTLPSPSETVISLPPDIFAQPIRRDILHRCVVWYLSLLRSGTASTKTRSSVAYSGRKMRPQKGTGRARQGDAGAGTRRGGAPIFPIQPKNWAQSLPRKVRELGLRIALSSKLSSGVLRVVENLNEGEWTGTAEARRALCDSLVYPGSTSTSSPVDLEPIIPLNASEGEQTAETGTSSSVESAVTEVQVLSRFGRVEDLSILFLFSPNKPHEEIDAFHRVVRNVPGIEVMSTDEVQVYHVLKYKWLVLEGGAVDALSGFEILEDEGLEMLAEDVDGDVRAIA
ncbi:50S ribosomal protein L4 [Kwoniella shandongensis]|uniref:Large ribosomal subunit protein uL4m n=1 Tax=Kwoniella shandongensis TaxID=1734106 RepID=A0A5M6C9F9_9TREE|nr:50S ribosomal protein L4 [Kwoniella shandongensis]KAA5529829.1 50S ribosomal protein L4 [Kwoniella shandongensis]